MTLDRFEQQLSEGLVDLAAAHVPDYVEDLLQRTSRTRQRPAWTSIERWLSVDIGVPLSATRGPAWRPFVIMAILALLGILGAVVYVASRPPRALPPPFGPAANGAIVIGSVSAGQGDIVLVDPLTGDSSILIGGPTNDVAPTFSNDGRRLAFLRTFSHVLAAVFVANADGSGVRQVTPTWPSIESFRWSPDGERLAVTRKVRSLHETEIVAVATGESTPLDLDAQLRVTDVTWRPGTNQLILHHADPEGRPGATFFRANEAGRNPRGIPVAADAVLDGSLSPDGRLIAYSSWTSTTGREGRVHLIDIESGIDREPLLEGSAGSIDLDPTFSPDGTKLLIDRYSEDSYQVVVVPSDGVGPAIPLGPRHPTGTGGSHALFSPDGTMVLVSYNDNGDMWLFDTDGGEERRLPWTGPEGLTWPGPEGLTWQRLAL
jgi:Tol biopolymer transport system component